MIISTQVHDIATPTGVMRTTVFRPDQAGQFASVIF